MGNWLKLHSSLEMESACFSRLLTIVPCTVVGEKFDNENDVPKWYFLKENIMPFPSPLREISSKIQSCLLGQFPGAKSASECKGVVVFTMRDLHFRVITFVPI